MDKSLTEFLDLPQVTVTACIRLEGIMSFHLDLTPAGIDCPHCHCYTTQINQNRPVLVRDLPCFGKTVYLRVPRRQFYCPTCQRYSTEALQWVDWQRRHTRRYEENIYERVLAAGIESVARSEELSFDEIEGIFNHISSQRLKKNWQPVKRISIDEISMKKGHQSFKTVVSDIDKGVLIEVLDGRTIEVVESQLMEQPLSLREAVEEVSIDMCNVFINVIPKVFPLAKIVTDRFHVIKPILAELKKIARMEGIRGFTKTSLLLTNGDKLSEKQKEELEILLQESKRLRRAYCLKEKFQEIYQTSQTPEEGKQRFENWLKSASKIYGQVITTIRNHLETICNYFISRASSGVMEGINNKIKQIKRQAYGFRNFENFRARLLAHFLD